MNIRLVIRTLRAFPHLLPARGLGAARSRLDWFSYRSFGKLFDRRRYSVAAFDGGKLTSYELHTGERGIVSDVASPPR